ncbi:MAG: M23 family metallopeptidase [Dechloromonas sp.]|nr:MAG: M23 family metallopeptidase [Dechloromonas sp.]
MHLPGIHWPLEANSIRKNSPANTFGMVRNGGKRAHQGWDLLAYPGTRCFSIAEGEVVFVGSRGDYGKVIILKFRHRGRNLFATYAHLSMSVVTAGEQVRAGAWIGLTGNTGNAESMTGENHHLHFEIRTVEHPGHGLEGRIDPQEIFGVVPLKTTYFDSRPPMAQRIGSGNPGIRIAGVNVQ